MKLFVANLAYSVTGEELKTVFGRCGTVVSAQVIMDRNTGRSRGFGFVEMSSQEETDSAVKELNETDIQGRNIVVKPAESKAVTR